MVTLLLKAGAGPEAVNSVRMSFLSIASQHKLEGDTFDFVKGKAVL